MIAGKGHEQGQEFEDGRKIPFDDRDVAREELRKLEGERRKLISLDGDRLASLAGAEVLAAEAPGGPERAVIDSREVREGDLFVGLPGERFDGGEFGAAALRDGAWGILVRDAVGTRARDAARRRCGARRRGLGARRGGPSRLAPVPRPRLARASSTARVVGITGSTGKTSVKDICRALLPGRGPRQPRELQHRDRPAARHAGRA